MNSRKMSLESALVMDVDFIVNDALKGYYVSDKVYTPFKSQVIRNFFAMLSINIGARYKEEPVAQELADILYKMNIRWQKPSIDLFDWVNSQCVSFGGKDPHFQYITTHLYETDYRMRDSWDDLQKIKSENSSIFEYMDQSLQHYLGILEIKPNDKEPSEVTEVELHSRVREKLKPFEESLHRFLPYDDTPMVLVPVEDNIDFLSKNERYVLIPDKQSVVFSKIFNKGRGEDLELEF